MRRLTVILSILLLLQAAAPRRAHAIAAGLAGALSIIPGLGQLATGNGLEGAAWFVGVIGTSAVKPYVAWDLWQYNLYDAYRDAKPDDHRYKDHTALQNYAAVYNPANFLDPIGAPLLVGYGAYPGLRRYHGSNLYPLKAVSMSFIGPAEEGLFRGFLFPAFSSALSSKIAGALISSALFGLIHTQYGASGKIAVGLYGLVACWQIDRNNYDLRKNSFTHSWVDFFLLPKGVGPLESAPTSENSGTEIPVGLRWNLAF